MAFGILENCAHILFAQLLRNVQSQCGELDGDIGVNARLLNTLQGSYISLGGGLCFLGIGAIFTEVIEGDLLMTPVEYSRGFNCIV